MGKNLLLITDLPICRLPIPELGNDISISEHTKYCVLLITTLVTVCEQVR
jgi:hypothetical protein